MAGEQLEATCSTNHTSFRFRKELEFDLPRAVQHHEITFYCEFLSSELSVTIPELEPAYGAVCASGGTETPNRLYTDESGSKAIEGGLSFISVCFIDKLILSVFVL